MLIAKAIPPCFIKHFFLMLVAKTIPACFIKHFFCQLLFISPVTNYGGILASWEEEGQKYQ